MSSDSVDGVFIGDYVPATAFFSTVLAFDIVFFTTVTILFYLNRHKQPIRARPFRTTIAVFPLMLIYTTQVSMRWIWVQESSTVPCVLFVLFTGPPLAILLNLYLIRSWILFFQYHLTLEKCAVRSPCDVAKEPQKGTQSSWFIDRTHYISDKFLFRIFMVKSLIEIIALLWLPTFIAFPEVASATLERDGVFCSSTELNTYTLLGIVFYDAIMIVYAAIKLGKVEDGFYLKGELKHVAFVGLFGGVAYGVVAPFYQTLQTAILVCCGTLLGVISGLYLIIRAYRTPQARSYHTSISQSTLRRFDNLNELLQDPEGRHAFREHLKLEFSIENLMFWEAVEDFRQEFSEETPSRNRELAIGIYDQFIAQHAPLQINITYTLLSEVQLAVNDSGPIKAAIFEKTKNSIVNLMATDSFTRFQLQQKRALKLESEADNRKSLSSEHGHSISSLDTAAATTASVSFSPKGRSRTPFGNGGASQSQIAITPLSIDMPPPVTMSMSSPSHVRQFSRQRSPKGRTPSYTAFSATSDGGDSVCHG